ncbi:unnamed protein product [Ceratitis capitata]|uniref:(Mediterranean fruit fly) hypothetical protein n=1 Tax=Ceratitis capitata TaxID=7213 RepID=A0A811VDJ2_CERCA|nr:unnamed protein product [Ceratitis capitata]
MLDGKESPTDKNVEDHSKEFTIVMDDDDDDKEKSLIIEVEGGTNSGEKEPLKVVIDAKTINENSGDKWVANDKTVGVGDKNAKNKLETVSECAKRVIESLQASEKRKEMEKKEISKKEPSGNTVTTTSAPATPATRSSSTELPTDDVTIASVDDTIEPILIDESDVGDSVDSPMKQNKQSETTVTEKKQTGTAGYVDMSTTKTTITTTKKDGLIACAIKAATDNENIAELNEPEIDVEKEIEALLMNKSEEPENERNAGADTPSIADAAQTDQTPTAKTVTSELLSDSVDNLMESESAAALT